MSARRFKSYVAVVEDAEGVAYHYVSIARSRRHATKEVRESASRWGAKVVAIEPIVQRRESVRRRRDLVVVGGITFAVSGITIVTMMIIGLSLEGAL